MRESYTVSFFLWSCCSEFHCNILQRAQCRRNWCFKRPGVYKIILVMRAVFNFIRYPLLGVLPSTLVGFLLVCCWFWGLFFCYLVVPQCSSFISCSFCFAVFWERGKKTSVGFVFCLSVEKTLHQNCYFLVNIYADWIFTFSNIFLWLKALILNPYFFFKGET